MLVDVCYFGVRWLVFVVYCFMLCDVAPLSLIVVCCLLRCVVVAVRCVSHVVCHSLVVGCRLLLLFADC